MLCAAPSPRSPHHIITHHHIQDFEASKDEKAASTTKEASGIMSALIATLTIDQHGSLLELVLQHLDDGPYAWPSPHLVQSKGVCKLFAQLARRLLLKRWSLARAMVLPWMPHRLDAMLNWHREVNAMLKSTQWHGRGRD